MLGLSSPLHAQDGEEDPGTGFEGGGSVEDPTPIDGNLIWLAAAGIGLLVYQSSKPTGESPSKAKR
ncbi:hypothetical protein HYN49_04565 [Flavobacterium pallidum]|uniref:Uncharacterized protein n=2 Tax=Flavobacterium pallidum TaxID=2172098 RepID=A0A2S1SFR3_9FLAO|nr:hypothetical protein HYN49_04565 [Flavobacterium pallidum]